MIKKIITYLILFVLIITMTSSLTLVIFSSTLFNEKYIISIFESQNYYSKTYNLIMENFKDNTVQSGLENTVLDGIITEDQIKEDTNILIKGLYEGTKIEIDSEIVKTRLKENIDKVIQENNKRVTKSEQEAINIYLSTIANIYENGVIYSSKYITEVQDVIVNLINAVNKVNNIVYIATIIILLLIIIINKKESLKYISISFIGTGILLIIPKIIESIAINTKNIVILNQVLSNLVICLIESVMMRFLIFGISIVVLGIVFSIIYGLNKKNKNI